MMSVEQMLAFVPAFVLAFFRLLGLMLASPLFGSANIPKRVKILFAAVATMGMMSALPPPGPNGVQFPPTMPELVLAIGGEMVFGLAMGMIVSFTFYAVQWAGELIGQQIGFNMGETLDPAYGGGGTLISDLYFMLALVVFFAASGHRILLMAVYESFSTQKLLTLTFGQGLFEMFLNLFTASTILAMRLAAPTFFAMLVVDLAMGCISRAMPQFNIMSAGVSLRGMLGILIVIVGLGLACEAMAGNLRWGLDLVRDVYGGAADGTGSGSASALAAGGARG